MRTLTHLIKIIWKEFGMLAKIMYFGLMVFPGLLAKPFASKIQNEWFGRAEVISISWGTALSVSIGVAVIWIIFALSRVTLRQEEKLKPKFNLSVDFSDHVVPGVNSDVGFKFVNICVENSSETNLEECTALLQSVLKNGQETAFHSSIPLEWSHPKNENMKTIVAGEKGIVHVVTSGSHSHNLNFWNKIKWARLEKIFDDPAIYQFKVLVNCGGVSDTIVFNVDWNGKWEEIKAGET